jgi:hypothetical protein
MPEQVHEFNIARFLQKIKRVFEEKTEKKVFPGVFRSVCWDAAVFPTRTRLS